ncbi:MAG: hypothetical protein E6G19_13225 [Actinobacteria bacterium]|nr:MAG: hypothetical protein E6G19_13225 [Actinomycetota bacterium]
MISNRRGMIHGRFQPFHNGHLEYLRGAAESLRRATRSATCPSRTRSLMPSAC